MRLFSRKVCRLLAILCIAALVLTACGDRTETTETEQETSSEEDLQARIQALEEENAQLRAQLEQYIGTVSQPTEAQTAEAETTTEQETQTEEGQTEEEDKLNIVVFGDSIWDMDRSETGIAAQVAEYMNANVYNCSIGGTRATLKEGESDVNYDTWDSTSLTGMCYVMLGLVDTNFLEGYPAGGVIRNVDPATVDYYIIAYGLNDYFSGAPIAVSGSDMFDSHGYTGALNNALALLKDVSPNAQFLLISPTYCQFYENGYMVTDSNMRDYGQGTLSDYANACRNVAEMKGTLYIDAYTTMGINIYTAEEYLEDGVHLTEAGRTLYARAVSSCLKYGEPGEVSGNSVYY